MNTIEPLFLSQALAKGIKLRIGQMNKIDHEGVIRDVGRYEINIEERGQIVTILKQDISHITASDLIMTVPPPAAVDHTDADHTPAKPNIQQEFLDKAIRDEMALTVFLLTGNRIKATLEAYDNFTLLLLENGRQHLYYKHAITTINR